MESVSRLLPAVDAPPGGIRWPILAQLTKAVAHERLISDEIKSAVKFKLKSEHALPCLNCLTILHTLAFNVDATVRLQMAHPSVFKRIEKTTAKPCSAAVAAAVYQVLVDWAYAFRHEELGVRSREKLHHLRARQGEGAQPSSVAVAFLDEQHMGMPRLGFRRGLDFAKQLAADAAGERAMSPMSPLTAYYNQRPHHGAEAPGHRRQSSDLAEVDSLLAAARELAPQKVMEVVERIMRTVAQLQEAGRSCLEAALPGALEGVRSPLDAGFLAACRCSSWRTRVQSMAPLVTNDTAMGHLLSAADSLNSALADWQALTTRHLLPALYPSHHHHPRRSSTTAAAPPPAVGPPSTHPPPDIIDADPLPTAPPILTPHVSVHLLDTAPSHPLYSPIPDLLTSSPLPSTASVPGPADPQTHPAPAVPAPPSTNTSPPMLQGPQGSTSDTFFGTTPLFNPFASTPTGPPRPAPGTAPQSSSTPTSPSDPSPPAAPNPLHSAPQPHLHTASPPQANPPMPTRHAPPPPQLTSRSAAPATASAPPPMPYPTSQLPAQPPASADVNPFRNPPPQPKSHPFAAYLRGIPLNQVPRASQPSPRQPPLPPQSYPQPTPLSPSATPGPPQPNGHHHLQQHHPSPAPYPPNPHSIPASQVLPSHRPHPDPSHHSVPPPSPYTTPNPSPRALPPNPFDVPPPSPSPLSPRPPSPNPLTSPRPPTAPPPLPLLAQLEAIISTAPHPTCLCQACKGLSGAPGRKLLERIRQLLASCHRQHEDEVGKLRAALAAHQEQLARMEAGHQQELKALKATAVQKMREVLQSHASISSSRPTSPLPPASASSSPEPHPSSPDPGPPSKPTLITLSSHSAPSSSPPRVPPHQPQQQQQQAPSVAEAALRAELAALRAERNSLAARLAHLEPSTARSSSGGLEGTPRTSFPSPPYPLLMGYMLLTGDAPPPPGDHPPPPAPLRHPEPSQELI